jgi:hypothetical protein
MSDSSDYYRLLHVDPDAPVEIIRSSYRTLMQRLKKHPDLGGDHKQAALINQAYAVLTDPARRAEYDRGRVRPAFAARSSRGDRCPFCSAPQPVSRAPEPDDRCATCGSPRYPAESLRHAAAGERLMERMPREFAVTCYTHWPQSPGHDAVSRDLSLNGMQIAAGFAIEEDRLVKIDSLPCQALARVAWCTAHDGEWLIGLEFVTLSFHRTRGSFVSTEA